jgi:protoporphyrinogen oxidase
MKKVVIIGAGPAGLTAAYLLLKNKNIDVTILEESSYIGGISKTINYNGNRMDIGGHRFFTKNEEVMKLWEEIMPIQNKPAKDDLIIDSNKKLPSKGLDPNKNDNVLLIRRRVSRILYDNKFYDYPVSFNYKTIHNLGLIKTIICGFSYVKGALFKRQENNLEDFYINRFGQKLYGMFFAGYTEKVWGRSPKNISALWGKQRVKGISIKELIKNVFKKSKEISLIEQFYYPKYGPGALYEEMAKKIIKMGGKIIFKAKVNKISIKNNKIDYLIYNHEKINADIYISSMAIKDLIEDIPNPNKEILSLASNLPYRDFITIGLLVKKLQIKNNTKFKTINNIIPDTWIYVQDERVKLGRIQVFNNWSPYLVNDEDNIFLGLEYFCNEGDSFWNKKDDDLINIAIEEITKLKIINEEDVIDKTLIRQKKAYPAYFDSYKDIDKIKNYLFKIDNLYCIGRNGQHHYNNMDHSIKTGMIAAKEIINNQKDDNLLWNVNMEQEYHEVKNDK